VRLFVAVRPPAAALRSLAEALGLDVDDRWHLTLAFLGEQPDPEPFVRPLTEAALRSTPFPLALAGGQTFGGRVLSAAVAGDVAALDRLARDVQDACRRAGAELDARPFRPHLTVARGRGLQVPAALSSYEGPSWVVEQLELVHSHLGGRARHEVLARLPLCARKRNVVGSFPPANQPLDIPFIAP
jgi:2'-5' RNA ligase